MKALGYSIPFIILISGVAGLVGLSSLRTDPPKTEATVDVPLVETELVRGHDEGFFIAVDGEVIAYREVNIGTQVAGQISRKSPKARAGNFVRKGDLLFEIDKRDYELEVQRLEAMVKQASASIEEADVEKENAMDMVEIADQQLALQRREVARFRDLQTQNAGSVSRFETARQAELQSLNALQSQKNILRSIKAKRSRLLRERDRAMTNLEKASLDLTRTRVESPLDGIVVQDMVETDDFVQIGAQLIQLEDTSRAEIRFNMRMDQLRWLWGSNGTQTDNASQVGYALPKINVRVSIEIDGNRFRWDARLDRYDGAGIDVATRTVPVIAVVDEPTNVIAMDKDDDAIPLPAPPRLMRGTFVTLELPVGQSMELVEISTRSLRPGKQIYLFDNGKLKIQKVRIAFSNREKTLLLAGKGLAAGDRVVVSPLQVADENTTMELQESNSVADVPSETPSL